MSASTTNRITSFNCFFVTFRHLFGSWKSARVPVKVTRIASPFETASRITLESTRILPFCLIHI